MEISTYAATIEPSATMAAAAKAKELKAAGVEVFDFSLGEPDFDTPAHIGDAARKAIADGHTHYTPASGIPALKQAICDYHRHMHGLDYKPANVCVSNGAKHAIYTAFCAVLNPGDEVIIPAPYWVSYSEMVKMTGARPVIVPTTADAEFKIDPTQLRASCTARSKMFLLNSPCNPTGTTYTPAELDRLGETVVEKDLLVLTDEIYERLVYGGARFQAFASLGAELFNRTLTVNGVSKTYAMTGWRIGWTAGPANVIKAMDGVQGQQTSNPCSISQYAAVAALNGDQQCISKMKAEFAKRCEYVVGRISRIRGLKLTPPGGAFYAFFDVSSYFGKTFRTNTVTDSASFCLAALEQAHVSLVQGAAFGAEGFVRLSFATSMEIIERGLDALEAWLATGKG